MTPSLRSRALSGQLKCIPKCLDDIAVLWNEADGASWWPAQVLSVSVCPPETNCVASGTIVYASKLGYEEEIWNVEFLFSQKEGQMVKHIAPCHDQSDSEVYLNTVNAINAWTLESAVDSARVTKRLKVKDRFNMKPHCSGIKNKTLHSSSHCCPTDQHFRADSGAELTPNSKNTSLEALDPTYTIAKGRNVPELTTKDGNIDFGESPTTQTCLPSNLLPAAFDDISKRLNKLEQVMTEGIPHHSVPKTVCEDEALHLVILNLKHAFLSKWQRCVPPKSFLSSGTEGLVDHSVSCHTPCSLALFSRFAAHVSKHADVGPAAHFSPSFYACEKPSTAAQCLSIRFCTFAPILQIINLRDGRDYDKILFREGADNKRPFLRILGAHKRLSSAKTKEGCEIDMICVGVSVPVDEAENAGDGQTSTPNDSYTECLVLRRRREIWDDSLGRFLDPWEAKRQSFPILTETISRAPNEGDSFKYCKVLWKAAEPLSSRVWTADALRTNEVLGKLEIQLPVVMLYGTTYIPDIVQLLHSEDVVPIPSVVS